MKKLLLAVLLMMSGCSISKNVDTTNANLMIAYPKSDAKVSKNVYEVHDEVELVSYLDQSLMNKENSFTYRTDNHIDLDEVVRMLSYLVPFDIKLKQMQHTLRTNTTYEIIIEYTDTEYDEVIAFLKELINKNISSDMTMSEKIDFAHQYILDHCDYDENVIERDENNAEAFQIQGVLFDGKAVCAGYSRCFLMMMKLMGIPCLYVSSDVINHSFNLVYDGEYRFIDVTWDEGDNRYYYLDRDHFFDDGKHRLNENYDSEYFMNFLSYVYHLN